MYYLPEYSKSGNIYPNPFFDLLNHYIPYNLKELFKWFEYVYFANPIVSAVINKFTSYPITSLVFENSDFDTVDIYKQELEKINWKSLLQNIGIDLFVYGNSFLVSFVKINKYYECNVCGSVGSITAIENFKLKKSNIASGKCPNCSAVSSFKLKDILNLNEIKFVRWNPKLISIKQNPLTDDFRYFSDIPEEIRDGILSNDPFIIEGTPENIIQAVKAGKQVELKKEFVFHLKRQSLAGNNKGWGMSALLPVLKHLFLIQVLRKANEALAFDHIVPLRIIYPQATSSTNDPSTFINLDNFKKFIDETLKNWRKDPNLIMTSPLPLGETHIGGDGKLLDVTPQIQQLLSEVFAGLGVPQEFVFGGLSWTGSSVSLRMLENSLINYTNDLVRVLQWMVDLIAMHKKIPSVTVKLEPFKLVDDVQQKGILTQLAASNIISKETLLHAFGLDFSKELEKIQKEQQKLQELFGSNE